MARKTLSDINPPSYYYELRDSSPTVSGNTVTVSLPNFVDGDAINGLEIFFLAAITTTFNVIAYFRINNANITGDNVLFRGYRSSTTLVQPDTSQVAAPGYNMVYAGLPIGTTDFNLSSDLWLHARIFTRTGSFRHSVSNYGSQPSATQDSLICAQTTSNWRDSTTKITSAGITLSTSSGFTATTVKSLVVRSF